MKATWLASLLVIFTLSGCDMDSGGEEINTPESAASANAGKKDCGCRDVEATLYTTANFETFTATGTVVGDLNGTIAFTGDPNSLSQISSEPFPPVNPGTFSFTSQLEFITKKGTITTRGIGLAELGPLGAGTELHQIIGGTDKFEQATGTFYLSVRGDETGANFVEYLTGQLCLAPPTCD